MMPFSRLFAILVLAGVIPVLAGSLIGGAFIISLAYDFILTVLLAVDLIITPSARVLEVRRDCDERFSLAAENEIAVRIRNNSSHALKIDFRDDIPPCFECRYEKGKIKALPHAESTGRFFVKPQKRGEFPFGKLHIRYDGVMGLCSKRGIFDLEKSYKVYPNLRDIRKYNLRALKKNLVLEGGRKAGIYGSGTEFESLREYVEGDDYRKINWMATARYGRVTVNAYEPEKNQQVFIMLDSSRIMNAEINRIKKLDYAINSAFILADAVIGNGDKTGLVVFDSDVRRFVKPGKGTGHFRFIADSLYNIEENYVTADYERALVYLGGYQKRRSLLCIFTELFNPDEALRLAAALKSAAKRHIPVVITIKDTRVYEIAERPVRNEDDVFQKSAAIRLAEERERTKAVLRNSGIATVDVPPDKLSLEAINRYLAMKAMMQV